MMHLFHDVCKQCSRIVTHRYSTSFSSAIRFLHKDLRTPVYNIYGFVRLADEIVDTFHQYNKLELLNEFKKETYNAIDRRISLNPILHSFQQTINDYGVDRHLIESFFNSMEFDLDKTKYDRIAYQEYIYGSAEVVGLMCLYVFCESDRVNFEKLKPYARSLGAAFQKVNFLRDAKSDYVTLDRTYFPGVDFENFTGQMKLQIEEEISADFTSAYQGILGLPLKARFGVYLAYKYYLSLFNKIKRTHPAYLLHKRIRVPNYSKALITMRAGLKNQLNLI